ncbi:MAG TPA: M28 family peptidase [Candidatus Baltobacteraceae bacterium]
MSFLRAFSAAIAVIFCCSFATPMRGRADGSAPRGYLASQAAAEARDEAIVDASPQAAQATRDEMGLASYVHRMGQPGDLRSAIYVRDQLRKAGWNANLVTYVVPIAWPYRQELTLLSPHKVAIDLHEPAVPGDPYSRNHKAIGVPYSGYSNDGDVTGPIVYANEATPADFQALAAMHVNVRGAIIIARVGGGALTGKAFEGAKHGAKAVFVFADPMSGGYWNGDTYPKGPWRPLGGTMRNTMTFTNDPGDPTAIGIPVPGAKHKPFSAIKLPSIPEMPITGIVAKQLLAAMSGPSAPADWHPGFGMAIHLGGNAHARAHFVLKSKRFFGPIWDVIATMPGVDAKQMVVVGGHRDAWTYGAVDPISGTVDLLQLGRAYGKLRETGWKPQRTVVIASWDGEELNLFGSATWVQQHEKELRDGMVAYVNTDEVAYGPTFGAYATPDLDGVILSVATVATAPDGRALSAYWAAQGKRSGIGAIGGGSDHESFVYHENLPAAGAGYGGPFGTYHSAYDDPASLRILDPGMHYSVAASRFTSLLVLRLADATYPDVRLGALAHALRDRITAFAAEKTDDPARRAAVAAQLGLDADAFVTAADRLDAVADGDVRDGRTADAAAVYQDLRGSEAAFFDTQTTAWQRTLLYDLNGYTSSTLPTLDATLDPTTGAAALATLDTAFKNAIAATTGS